MLGRVENNVFFQLVCCLLLRRPVVCHVTDQYSVQSSKFQNNLKSNSETDLSYPILAYPVKIFPFSLSSSLSIFLNQK